MQYVAYQQSICASSRASHCFEMKFSFPHSFHDVTSQKVSYLYDSFSVENTQIKLHHINRKKIKISVGQD